MQNQTQNSGHSCHLSIRDSTASIALCAKKAARAIRSITRVTNGQQSPTCDTIKTACLDMRFLMSTGLGASPPSACPFLPSFRHDGRRREANFEEFQHTANHQCQQACDGDSPEQGLTEGHPLTRVSAGEQQKRCYYYINYGRGASHRHTQEEENRYEVIIVLCLQHGRRAQAPLPRRA